MQLDKYTDYGLRILIMLAVRTPDRVSITEISDAFDISANHLSKIATVLVRGGFLKSERGRAGGLTLMGDAKDINVGTVVRYLKQDTPVVECLGENKTCCIIPACGLQGPLKAAQDAFFEVLDAYTLNDITAKKSALKALMSET